MIKSERNPQSDNKTLKPQFAWKTALEKSLTKQNKNKQIARHSDRNRETEPELTLLFKNNSFDISLYREFLYTSHAGFFFMWGVSLTHPVLASFLYGEFLLHIPCWLHFYAANFSYTFRAGFFFSFVSGEFVTHSALAWFFCGEFLLHIPWFFCGEFFLHIRCWLLFVLIWGLSLTHPVLASYLCGEFLLHTPYWLYFYLGSFSYISCAGFICIWGVSLTHPVLASFLSGEFFLHIPCWFLFYPRSLSYTSRTGFVSLSLFYLGSLSYTSRVAFFIYFLYGELLWNAVFSEDNP